MSKKKSQQQQKLSSWVPSSEPFTTVVTFGCWNDRNRTELLDVGGVLDRIVHAECTNAHNTHTKLMLLISGDNVYPKDGYDVAFMRAGFAALKEFANRHPETHMSAMFALGNHEFHCCDMLNEQIKCVHGLTQPSASVTHPFQHTSIQSFCAQTIRVRNTTIHVVTIDTNLFELFENKAKYNCKPVTPDACHMNRKDRRYTNPWIAKQRRFALQEMSRVNEMAAATDDEWRVLVMGHVPPYSLKFKKGRYTLTRCEGVISLLRNMRRKLASVHAMDYVCADTHNYQRYDMHVPALVTSSTLTQCVGVHIVGTGGASLDNYLPTHVRTNGHRSHYRRHHASHVEPSPTPPCLVDSGIRVTFHEVERCYGAAFWDASASTFCFLGSTVADTDDDGGTDVAMTDDALANEHVEAKAAEAKAAFAVDPHDDDAQAVKCIMRRLMHRRRKGRRVAKTNAGSRLGTKRHRRHDSVVLTRRRHRGSSSRVVIAGSGSHARWPTRNRHLRSKASKGGGQGLFDFDFLGLGSQSLLGSSPSSPSP